MIRYVVAVLLATALLGLGFAAVQEVSMVRGETQVESAVTAIEDAAASLLAHDDPVPSDENPPRRVIDIDLPPGGFASPSVDQLVFEPVLDGNRTVVRYQFDGRTENTVHLDVPLVNAAVDAESVDLNGSSGSRTVVLELTLDERHEPLIRVTVQ